MPYHRLQAALDTDKYSDLINWLDRYCTDNHLSQSRAIIEAVQCLKALDDKYGDWRLALNNDAYIDLIADKVAKRLDSKMVVSANVESDGSVDKLEIEDELF